MDKQKAGSSESELIQWLKTGSKTFGWDAVVAYDRATINAVFRERFVRLASGQVHFPLINGIVAYEGRNYGSLDNVVLGAPHVSFEQSNIVESVPLVKVTLSVIAGTESKLQYGIDGRVTATRISAISAINSPELTGTLAFEDLRQEGTVGVVAVDLKKGTYRAELGGATNWEAEQWGRFFKAHIANWTDEQSVWEVNRVHRNQGMMAVKRFALRSQRASPAAVRGVPGYGEGAVVVFVELESSTSTPGFPSSEDQMKYLIPSDADREYTSTMLIRDEAMVRMFVVGVIDAENSPYLDGPMRGEFREVDGVRKFHATSGSVRLSGPANPVAVEFDQTLLVLDCTARMAVHNPSSYLSVWVDPSVPGSIYTHVVRMRLSIVNARLNVLYTPVKNDTDGYEIISGNVSAGVGMRLDVATQKIVLSAGSGDVDNLVAPPRYTEPGSVYPRRGHTLEQAIRRLLYTGVDLTGYEDLEFEKLPLNTLLFDKPFSNFLDAMRTPADTVIFGHVAPDQLNFQITDPFPVLEAGNTRVLHVTPAVTGVTWSIANLPGESHAIGQISATTGSYTGPSSAQISGAQVRAIVTATKGQTTASALVTVVRRSPDLRPLIQLIDRGSPVPVELSVGTMSITTPVWGSIPAESGRLEPVADKPNVRAFYAPTAAKPGATMDVVPVTVTVAGNTAKSFVGVMHSQPVFNPIAQDFDPSGSQVRLVSTVLPGFPAAWTVVAGSATIDGDGLLTADANPEHPFALVTFEQDLSVMVMWGYILLPLPFKPFPEEPVDTFAQARTLSDIVLR